MSFITRALGLGGETRSISYQDVFSQALDLVMGPKTAGMRVTPTSALQLSAVYGSVRIISEGIATLPIDAYLRDGTERLSLNPQPDWLHNPHRDYEWALFAGQLVTSLLLHGNGYAAITRDADGRVLELTPLDPTSIEPELVNGRVMYAALGRLWSSAEVLHIPGMMLPGAIKGISPISASSQVVGLSLAAQTFGATFFGSDATPGGIIEVPQQLTPNGVRATKRAIRDANGGADKRDIAVLTEGAKFTQISISPDESQFLETRQFQVPDIARLFGVPPHLLQDASGSTSWGTGLAEQSQNYVTHTLRPWITRIETRLTRLLLSEGASPRAFVRINVDGLLRGDYTTRWTTHRANVLAGLQTTNEVRSIEDLPALEGGDDLLRPLNMEIVGAPTTPQGLNL